ncbi:hypothetical protein X986_3889 [Burkholderia pseudomallei]|uniref:hypothetical protein n=1 Tax=Burkholderia pseudomallei TaxID=28450 RepID=UPI0005375A35|nr:hypothetical protein [Burkholderia pseudomallei]KGX12741.1 hypothetical protein X984_3597 [Burkholderia pseudomallei]KGX27085.1 hypothetical protein X986_3889 [Burkholderia pseudomallei]
MKITDDMLTECFPPHIKPVHIGVYPACMEVVTDRFGTSHIEYGFARWDGQRWGLMQSDIKSAEQSIFHAASQAKTWRGLKKKHHREISRRVELAMTTRGK